MREFEQLPVREQDGAIVRLGDVADVVLGAEDYDAVVNAGQTAVFIGVWALPTCRSDVIKRVYTGSTRCRRRSRSRSSSRRLRRYRLRPGRHHEGRPTLAETLLIVVVVIFLFLGSLRSVLVPVVAIPVSLIGAVFLMQVFRVHGEPPDAARSCSPSASWWTTRSWWSRTSSVTCATG